MEGTLDWACLV